MKLAKQQRFEFPAAHSVQDFVREKLRDLPLRQEAREQKRKAQRALVPSRRDA
jgi:hypothetical protein